MYIFLTTIVPALIKYITKDEKNISAAVKALRCFMSKEEKENFEDKWDSALICPPHRGLAIIVPGFPRPSDLHSFFTTFRAWANDIKGICPIHCSRETPLLIFSAVGNT